MKKLLFFLFLVFFSFAGGVIAVRRDILRFVSNKMLSTKPPSADSSFIPTPYPLQNRFFTVIVIGRNNGASVERTLTSVFTQNYENFRIVYVDDGSDDGSFELARDLIYDMKYLIPTTLVRNEEPLGPLLNLSRAIQTCSDQEIVVIVDGTDWLAHEWVLQKLNQYYADSDLWMTYGQFRNSPTFELGDVGFCQSKEIRAAPFSSFHLQTFYAALFKKIKESDFMYSGQYFRNAAPLAYIAPMMEMADSHFQYISDTLYIVDPTITVESNQEQKILFEQYIRSLEPYAPLSSLLEPNEI